MLSRIPRAAWDTEAIFTGESESKVAFAFTKISTRGYMRVL